ncbi:ExbD/TolR family protein [Alienimonas californiensis]|uniref:Biopolymer transport protein ExbD/TolR n=1 Tax=Alienimonas californiensis TaxID=2527989 RepID=A0A517P6D3_9PLAN|nr:biopolymer transporter ExbD [Alienimonas californiensis]QDT14944.1 Biopolymer transport protein ExbD/TolR [Alienimonas californiensis]
MRVKEREPNVAEVDMTPMIDIVFQLIAFFMVITNFENTRADERVKLPIDAIARPTEAPREKDIVLNVGFNRLADGTIDPASPDALLFDTAEGGAGVPIPQSDTILAREARGFTDEGTKLEDVTVVIRADAEVPSGQIQNLITKAQGQQFTMFAVKAQQEEQ